MIAIIDYNAGNIQSVYKAFRHIGCDCVVTDDRDTILHADGAVLPGVGSFGDTVDSLDKGGIRETVLEFIRSGKPFLGICLGLQLLFPFSEESEGKRGLGLFEGSITKIPSGEGLKIPHMGWNSLHITKTRACLPVSRKTPMCTLYIPISSTLPKSPLWRHKRRTA